MSHSKKLKIGAEFKYLSVKSMRWRGAQEQRI
jgi:hypothetical protein